MLSSNGSSNVVYLDKQASSNGQVDPGFLTMVQLPAAGTTLTVPNGAYQDTSLVDLATSSSNDCNSPFSFSNNSVSAQCMVDGRLQAQTFSVASQAPMPAGMLGVVSGGVVGPMLLPLSADVWMRVTPTGSLSGSDASEPGSIGRFKRTGS